MLYQGIIKMLFNTSWCTFCVCKGMVYKHTHENQKEKFYFNCLIDDIRQLVFYTEGL